MLLTQSNSSKKELIFGGKLIWLLIQVYSQINQGLSKSFKVLANHSSLFWQINQDLNI